MNDNKLIAEFMGEKFTDNSGVVQGLNYKLIEKKHGKGNNGFRFHTSWDWLMPVVEKCFDTQQPEEGQHYFINESLLTMDIEVVYDRVVEFIKQYNESNKMDTLPPSVQQG